MWRFQGGHFQLLKCSRKIPRLQEWFARCYIRLFVCSEISMINGIFTDPRIWKIDYLTNPFWNPASLNTVKEKFKSRFGRACKIHVQIVDNIAPETSGKTRLIAQPRKKATRPRFFPKAGIRAGISRRSGVLKGGRRSSSLARTSGNNFLIPVRRTTHWRPSRW